MSKSIYCIGKKVNDHMLIKVCEKDSSPAKRVIIVSIKMVREGSILYIEEILYLILNNIFPTSITFKEIER